LKIKRAPAFAHAFAIAHAMLRLFATPKTRPTFPSKTGWVIKKDLKELRELQLCSDSAHRKPPPLPLSLRAGRLYSVAHFQHRKDAGVR
jgi:hypothetical protein